MNSLARTNVRRRSGGFITAHTLFRDEHPFKAGAAIVPATNLVFRLSYKGPAYQRSFSAQKDIQGLPFEQPEEYIKRSPVFRAENLKVPILVHVATNDEDVNFVEDQQMVYTLRALKPDLAETKINDHMKDLEVFEGTTKLVDELYGLIVG